MRVTVDYKAKMCLWYKTLIKAICLLGKGKLMNIETAVKIVCALSGKGFKYRVGKGKWRKINSNIEYQILKA